VIEKLGETLNHHLFERKRAFTL
jgi:serine/threonine protein kinase